MYTIATLTDLRRHLRLSSSDAEEDAILLGALGDASRLLEALTQRRYCPYRAALSVPLPPKPARELFLPADLLELRVISDARGPISLSDILRQPDIPDQPAQSLRRADGSPFAVDGGIDANVTVSGIWGWHDRWLSAWRDSLDAVVESPLSAAAASVKVADSAAADSAGMQPRFQVGQLLRIGEEYMRLTAIDAATRRLTLSRGVAGTSASDHALGAAIFTYQPAPAIRVMTLRIAALSIADRHLPELDSLPLVRQMRRHSA